MEEKLAAIKLFQHHIFFKDLRYFVGMLNLYRRFKPQAASIQALLHAASAGPKFEQSHPVNWTPTMVQTMEECKTSLYVPHF
jgi:hypothetical protein